MADTNPCRNCRVVLSSERTYASPWTSHHTSYSGLMASVAGGCVVCKWLSLQVQPPPDNHLASRESFQTSCEFSPISTSYAPKCGTAKFRGECSWAAPFDIEVHVYPQEIVSSGHDRPANIGNRNYLPPPGSPRHEGTALGSDMSINKIKVWLDGCNKDHTYCSKSINAPFFPTRIIDVQNVQNGTIVIREKAEVVSTNTSEAGSTASQASFPEYWTLSHRWGDPKKILQLYKGEKEGITSNERRFRSGIALEELSPTFRDAVQLVHRLGHRYIWIDSLCIFQDSKSDWDREAAMMKDVYGNSFCNISAIRSSYDVSLGLFGPRIVEPQLLSPFAVDMELPVDGKLQPGKWNFWYDSLLANEMSRAPLNSRGWVVQERFLARRIIHFSRAQMYWECLEHSRCEADPDGRLGLVGMDVRTREYKATLRKIIEHSTPRPEDRHPAGWMYSEQGWPTPRGCWRIMVKLYSGCDLTEEDDRLIAISGVAKRFEEFYANDKYLAGLWKQALHTDLMWESNAFQCAPVRRGGGVAPSWSWASVRGGSVTVPAAHQKFGGEPASHIEFVDARIKPESGGADSTELREFSELDIKGGLYFFKRAGTSKTFDVFADKALSKSTIQGIGSEGLRLDTEELVRKYDQEADFKGVCVLVQSASGGYGHYALSYLLVEKVSGSKYNRLGKLDGGCFGGGWDSNERTLITLI